MSLPIVWMPLSFREQGEQGGKAEQGKAKNKTPFAIGQVVELTSVDMDGLNGRENHPSPHHKGCLGRVTELLELISNGFGESDSNPHRPDWETVLQDAAASPDKYIWIYRVDFGPRFGTAKDAKRLILDVACYEIDPV